MTKCDVSPDSIRLRGKIPLLGLRRYSLVSMAKVTGVHFSRGGSAIIQLTFLSAAIITLFASIWYLALLDNIPEDSQMIGFGTSALLFIAFILSRRPRMVVRTTSGRAELVVNLFLFFPASRLVDVVEEIEKQLVNE